MKKLFSVVLTICLLVILTSCNNTYDWKKAEHTYSMLGFTVSYKYPKEYNSISSDDDPDMCIYANGIENKLDWSVSMSVADMNYLEFEDYRGEVSKTASDISQKDGIWTFFYKVPQERTILLKWIECGKLLIIRPANDFDYDDAFKIAKTFEVDVWGEDIR